MCRCWYVNLLEGWNTWSRGWYCDPRAIYFSIWTIQANEAIHPVTGTGSCFIVHWDCRNEWDRTRWWWWKWADTECKSRTTPFLKKYDFNLWNWYVEYHDWCFQRSLQYSSHTYVWVQIRAGTVKPTYNRLSRDLKTFRFLVSEW